MRVDPGKPRKVVGNSDLIEEGVADQIVERFAERRGALAEISGLCLHGGHEVGGGDEVLVTTR